MGTAHDLRTLHVVEPTLEDYAGHCYGLVRSLCEAASGRSRVTLWAGRHSRQLAFPENTELHAHFHRRWRQPQSWLLLGRLLRSTHDPIVLTTAKRSDLAVARMVARGTLPPHRLYLYFHWFRESARRAAFLRRVAAAQPNIGILATTESVAEIFRRAGFARVMHLPYPHTMAAGMSAAADTGFRHLLFAGAARADKGFGHVAGLVELLQHRGLSIPITVQVSPEHYGKYDDSTRLDLQRLDRATYRHLTLIREPLEPAAYARLFQGAICLQPYDPVEFADRTSGVTMDALTHGAPVVATSGTWIARQVAPRGAGVTLDVPDPALLLDAAQTLIAAYGEYRRNAIAAGSDLRARSWKPLFALLGQAGAPSAR